MANVFDKKLLKELCIIVVYGATQDDEKEEFLVKLEEICLNLSVPTIVGGDFNILRFSNEKNKNGGVTKYSVWFNDIISAAALREVDMSGDSTRGLMVNSTQLLKNWTGSL